MFSQQIRNYKFDQFELIFQVAMKVLSEKMNVLGLDLSKYSKTQLATASSDAINQKYKKVRVVVEQLV